MVKITETTEPTAPASASRWGWLRRALKIVGYVVFWLLLVIGAVLVGSAIWIQRTFGPISVDQMLMHLTETETGTPTGYLSSFLWQAVAAPLLILLAASALVFAMVRVIRVRLRQSKRSFDTGSLELSGKRRRRQFPLAGVVRAVAAVSVVSVGLMTFGQSVGLGQYIQSITTKFTMDKYYVIPDNEVAADSVVNVSEAPKNLVVIYLESGEETYSDESIFDFNMNAPLEEATASWASFDQLDTYEGGGWTMAGIVGTECGVPLRGAGVGVDDLNSNEIGAGSKEYMPGAVCLGDVLSSAGYYNVFMGGADANFASKSDFLRTHGYDEVLDFNTWLERGETEVAAWGLSDRRLMDHAKEQVTRLHESGQPFHLSMLTVDTHAPVHVYEYCDARDDDDMESVVRCSMEQVASFVEYLDQMGYLEDTAVFITGDHPKMVGEASAFYDELNDLSERPLFNRLWDPDDAQIQRTSIDQLSVYATLLDVLDLGRADGRAGIGVSALQPTTSRTGALALSPDEYKTMVQSRSSELYNELWSVYSGESTEVLGGPSEK